MKDSPGFFLIWQSFKAKDSKKKKEKGKPHMVLRMEGQIPKLSFKR